MKCSTLKYQPSYKRRADKYQQEARRTPPS